MSHVRFNWLSKASKYMHGMITSGNTHQRERDIPTNKLSIFKMIIEANLEEKNQIVLALDLHAHRKLDHEL